MNAQVTLSTAAAQGAQKEKEAGENKEKDMTGPLTEAIKALGAAAGHKKIIRGADGKASHTGPL
jgi:hypothetical protein